MSKISLSQFILKNPFIYWAYQRLVGGDTARKLFIKNNVKPVEGKKILDIGCGPGNILDFLPKMDYYGFDIDANYIEAAKQKYGDKGTFICSNMKEFVVPEPGTFDIVIATGVLHHLGDCDAKKLFKIASQALKPSGRLITFDGCYTDKQNFIAYLMLKFDRGKYVRTKKEYENLAAQSFSFINSVIDETYFHLPYTSVIMECLN
jgi:2-polyprenyl-3-methyl-5-hydroxy-6-metoxy-1,4-benzoquinol methylase